jgi:hypothetical protein
MSSSNDNIEALLSAPPRPAPNVVGETEDATSIARPTTATAAAATTIDDPTMTTITTDTKATAAATASSETKNSLPSSRYWREEVESELKQSSLWKRNPTLCTRVLNDILPQWYQDLSLVETLNSPWGKIRKRIVKELNESEPFITYLLQLMETKKDDNNKNNPETKFCIIDLCSGFGILSMLLSELLPPERVETIWLLDVSFPMDVTKIQKHHISVRHLQDRSWPIPLKFRKVDLKRGREIKQLHKYVFPSPEQDPQTKLVLVGVHLCKALSVHAINLYDSLVCRGSGSDRDKGSASSLSSSSSSPPVVALLLKPCCLPGRKHLYIRTADGGRTPLHYQFSNGYSFRVMDLYNKTTNNNNISQPNKTHHHENGCGGGGGSDGHDMTNHDKEAPQKEEEEEEQAWIPQTPGNDKDHFTECIDHHHRSTRKDNEETKTGVEPHEEEEDKRGDVGNIDQSLVLKYQESSSILTTMPAHVIPTPMTDTDDDDYDNNDDDDDDNDEEDHDSHDNEPESVRRPTTKTTTTKKKHKDHYCRDKGISHERFSRWVNHLYLGCQSDKCRVHVEHVTIQRTHFQNQFIFCETIQNSSGSGL